MAEAACRTARTLIEEELELRLEDDEETALDELVLV